MKKYELTDEKLDWNGHELYRIRALTDFVTITGREVKVGDLGGYVQSGNNLQQEGRCWVADNAKVYDIALVCDNAEVSVNGQVFEQAVVKNSAIVDDSINAYYPQIKGSARLIENARVRCQGVVRGNAVVGGNITIDCSVDVRGWSIIRGSATIGGWDADVAALEEDEPNSAATQEDRGGC